MSINVGKQAAMLAKKHGKLRNNTNIIKLPFWYALLQGLASVLFGSLLMIPLFVPEAYEDMKSMTLCIIFLSLYWPSMILLFLHFTLYKVVIEKENILFRRLFFYKKYKFKTMYVYPSSSYVFLYNGKKYITRFATLVSNIESFFDAYNGYFERTGLEKPEGPKGYIKQSKIWLILAFIEEICILCLISISFVAFPEIFYWTFLAEIPIVFLLLYYYLWHVKFDSKQLVYRNLFGIKRTFLIKELSYEFTDKGYVVKRNGRNAFYLWKIQNSDELLKLIKKEKENL